MVGAEAVWAGGARLRRLPTPEGLLAARNNKKGKGSSGLPVGCLPDTPLAPCLMQGLKLTLTWRRREH